MAEIVNLRTFAKKKRRQAKAAKSARNRAASGLSLIHISEPTRPY